MGNQEAKAAAGHHTERDESTATPISWAEMERTFIQELLNHPKLTSRRPVAATFSCFPKLPPEIHQMIWIYTLCHPEITGSTSFPKMLKKYILDYLEYVRKVPVALFAVYTEIWGTIHPSISSTLRLLYPSIFSISILGPYETGWVGGL